MVHDPHKWMVVPIVDWYSYCCTRSRSTSGAETAVPEVDRVLVQLKAVPKVDRLLVQLNAVPEVNQVLVQVIAVPEVDRLLVQHSCTNRRLVQIDFWYTTYTYILPVVVLWELWLLLLYKYIVMAHFGHPYSKSWLRPCLFWTGFEVWVRPHHVGESYTSLSPGTPELFLHHQRHSCS